MSKRLPRSNIASFIECMVRMFKNSPASCDARLETFDSDLLLPQPRKPDVPRWKVYSGNTQVDKFMGLCGKVGEQKWGKAAVLEPVGMALAQFWHCQRCWFDVVFVACSGWEKMLTGTHKKAIFFVCVLYFALHKQSFACHNDIYKKTIEIFEHFLNSILNRKVYTKTPKTMQFSLQCMFY